MASIGYFKDPNDKSNSWKHLCGGTIINRYIVLTAAHCFFSANVDLEFLKNAQLLLNDASLNDESDGRASKIYNISFVLGYKEYDGYRPRYDIAAILTTRKINQHTFVDVIPSIRLHGLPNSGDFQENSYFIAGWGGKNTISTYLREATFAVFNEFKCQEVTIETANDDHTFEGINDLFFCAGHLVSNCYMFIR